MAVSTRLALIAALTAGMLATGGGSAAGDENDRAAPVQVLLTDPAKTDAYSHGRGTPAKSTSWALSEVVTSAPHLISALRLPDGGVVPACLSPAASCPDSRRHAAAAVSRNARCRTRS